MAFGKEFERFAGQFPKTINVQFCKFQEELFKRIEMPLPLGQLNPLSI